MAKVNGAPIVGICTRPLPNVEPAAYLYCRSRAWLDALASARPMLPSLADRHLWEMDMKGSVAPLALAAFYFPVDTVTPDISTSPEIRVFLESKESDNIPNIWANPEKILIEITLIEEMRAILEKMHANWPKNVANIVGAESTLEELASTLSGLWKLATQLPEDAMADFPFQSTGIFAQPLASSASSALINIFRARDFLDKKMPQAAMEELSAGMESCEKMLSREDSEKQAWSYISAWLMYLRGVAHWKLNQPALAKNDFAKAERVMEDFGRNFALLTDISLARAQLMRSHGYPSDMCAELEKACARGECSELARARRAGECGDKQ